MKFRVVSAEVRTNAVGLEYIYYTAAPLSLLEHRTYRRTAHVPERHMDKWKEMIKNQNFDDLPDLDVMLEIVELPPFKRTEDGYPESSMIVLIRYYDGNPIEHARTIAERILEQNKYILL